MATIEDGLRAYLVTQASVTNLLATTNSIRTAKGPQESTRPFIRIELLNLSPEYCTSGQITLSEAMIRCHCEANDRTTARNIAEKIRLLFLTPYQTTMGSITVRNVMVAGIQDRLDSSPSDPSYELTSGSEVGKPGVYIDLNIWHLLPTS